MAFDKTDRDRLVRVETTQNFVCAQIGRLLKKQERDKAELGDRIERISGRVWGMMFIWVTILVGVIIGMKGL